MVSARLNRNSRCQSSRSYGGRLGPPWTPRRARPSPARRAPVPAGPQQLQHRGLRRAGRRCARPSAQRAQRVRAHDLQADPGPGRAGRAAPGRPPRRSAAPARSGSSSSRWKPTCWPSWPTPRSNASVAMATRQPSPASPTTRSRAVRAPSKNTSLNSTVPVSCRIGRTVTPGWRIGTSRYDRPGRRAASPARSGPARSTSRPRAASDVHTFWPVMTHSSPSRRRAWWPPRPGRSRRRARSSPGTTARSTAAIGGRNRRCCAGVPNAIRVGPSSSSPSGRPGRARRCARTPRGR